MIDIICIELTFCVDLWKIVLLYNILTREKMRSWKSLITITTVGGFLNIIIFYTNRTMLYFFTVIIILICSYCVFRKMKVKWLLMDNFILLTFDAVFISIKNFILKEDIADDYTFQILVDIVCFLVLVCVKHFFCKKINSGFNRQSITMLCFGMLGLNMFMIYAVNFGYTTVNVRSRELVALALSLPSLILMIILIGGSSFCVQNKKLKKDVELRDELLNQQRNYYKLLLLKEEKTKKFRHDIRGHMSCIRILLFEEKYDQVNDYLSAMETGLAELQLKIQTGNSIVNALVSDVMSTYPKIELQWTGMLRNELKIRSIDLCIIYSNLLNNAFKAVKDIAHPLVKVEVKAVGSNLFIRISNETVETYKIENAKLIIKKCTEGHGFGLVNVSECVDRYSGSLEIFYLNKYFIAEIVLPDAI